MIEALEDRRLLSVAVPHTAAPIHHPSGHKAIVALLVSHGVTLHLQVGQPFSGNVGYLSGIAKRLSSDLTLHASIAWGDGTLRSAGNVTIDSSGNVFVAGSHTYTKAGRFAITATVTATAASTATGPTPTFVLLVGTIHSKAIVSPSSSTGGVTLYETAGVPFTASVGTFVTLAPGTNLQASISWGDGSSSVGTIKAIGVIGIDEIKFEVDGTHTYANAGTYKIQTVVIRPGPTPTSPDVLIATINSTAIVAASTNLNLDGTITGTYSLAPTAATLGALYIFTGTGSAGAMGPVAADGRVSLPGPFTTFTQAYGTLTLTSASLSPLPGGSVTLSLTAPPSPLASSGFPPVLNYVITGGTGKFTGATGSGTIAVKLDDPTVDNGFMFVITSSK